MSLTVYWGSGSPYAWRVLLALELKGIPYTSKLLSFAEREHKSIAYLTVNPRGKVPAIEHDGYALYESLAILAYLDAKFPERPLLGDSPEATGQIWRKVLEIESYASPAANDVALPLYRGVAGKEDAVRAAAGKLRAELDRIEQWFEAGDWAAGHDVTAADVVLYPSLRAMLRALRKPAAAALDLGLGMEQWPRLGAWKTRFEALPGVAGTEPPHWKAAP